MTGLTRRALPIAALGLIALPLAPAAADDVAETQTITVYKTPTCGCCTKWVKHLQDAGFAVVAHDRTPQQMDRLKRERRIPRRLSSCHTALVDGYVVEGHVPASDVARLLEQRPAVVGLAVPRMPEGSPGMEGPNPEPYQVMAFDAAGRTEVFASHGP